MANVFSQIYLHLVFSPLGHENAIPQKHKEELQKYTTGIITNMKHKLLAINFMQDHVHIFAGYSPSQPLPDLVRDIKANSSRFINEKKWIAGKFRWQEGYGVFSYSRSQINYVINYINTQEKHHRTTTFKEEFLKILDKYEVDYDPRYLFDWI
ncbi:MAG: IS200/IS605 family transposase [Bacteroidales bacterium]|jgi:REP element-mobilizing transposase RayT|nr:IS200/IS605 family transposase [Bacteroidales bacterium]